MQNRNQVTVVIATLGGASLSSTVDSLNRGSMAPAEILICIPIEHIERVAHLKHDNVKILGTNFRGQVAQRLFGFKNASNDFVMQLDDDIILDEFCLERLLGTLHALGPKVAVAPAFLDIETGLSVYKKPEKNKRLLQAYYWLMNGSKGYVPGRIDKSGSSIGLDPLLLDSRVHDVEWLAGGCVLHYRNNLVYENFWPRVGKAYYEDVVHSSILAVRGIRLVIDSTARCSLEMISQLSLKPSDYFIDLYRDYLARRYFLEFSSRRSLRIYLYYLLRILSYMLIRLKA